jgi:type IV secretory pathway VirB2 component (pilin)
MLNLNKTHILVLVLVLAVLLLPDVALAGTFDSLTNSGKQIFQGLRKIIYPASAVGIICVCIAGAFGSINWKWLTAIAIGLLVISLCSEFIVLFSPDNTKPDLG